MGLTGSGSSAPVDADDGGDDAARAGAGGGDVRLRWSQGERRGHAAGLVGGYLVCWALIGVVALLLCVRGVSGPRQRTRPDTARILVGVTLIRIAAGVYQLTPLKDRCLSRAALRCAS